MMNGLMDSLGQSTSNKVLKDWLLNYIKAQVVAVTHRHGGVSVNFSLNIAQLLSNSDIEGN